MMLRTHVWFNYNDTFDYPWGIVVIICIRPDVVCDEVIGVYAFLTVTLQHLTRLILSNNRITYLPPDIVQLSSLEYLSLFNNHLEVSDTVTLSYRTHCHLGHIGNGTRGHWGTCPQKIYKCSLQFSFSQ